MGKKEKWASLLTIREMASSFWEDQFYAASSFDLTLELTGSEWSPLFGGQLDDIYGPDPTTGMHGALSDPSMTATMAPLAPVGTPATGQPSSSMDRYGVVYLHCGADFIVYLLSCFVLPTLLVLVELLSQGFN